MEGGGGRRIAIKNFTLSEMCLFQAAWAERLKTAKRAEKVRD